MLRRIATVTSPAIAAGCRRLSILSGVSEDLLISTSIGHQIGGSTHGGLIDSLVQTNVIRSSSRLERALRAVDRRYFAPAEARANPELVYANRPLKIGVVATISTPQQHAQVLGLLEEHLQPGMRAVDVGCGSGYLVAVMAHLVGATGHVRGVDIVPELVAFSERNLRENLEDELLSATSIRQSTGRDLHETLPTGESFDCVHVGVAVGSKAEAERFLEFVAPGGALLIPLGHAGQEQKLVKMTKHADGEVSKVDIMSVLCQPMLDDAPVAEPAPETRLEKIARLETALKEWREEFERREGHRPTREDMMNDVTAKALFGEYAALRK